jgi:hypothetical protein
MASESIKELYPDPLTFEAEHNFAKPINSECASQLLPST